MKRADLAVGEAYLHCVDRAWGVNPHHQRAVVVDLRPHVPVQVWGSRETTFEPRLSGSGVLVDLYWSSEATKPQRMTVRLGHLRGPYRETARQVTEQIVQQKTRERTRNAALRREKGRRVLLMVRAATLGYGGVRRLEDVKDKNCVDVRLDLDTLERLLDAADPAIPGDHP